MGAAYSMLNNNSLHPLGRGYLKSSNSTVILEYCKRVYFFVQNGRLETGLKLTIMTGFSFFFGLSGGKKMGIF